MTEELRSPNVAPTPSVAATAAFLKGPVLAETLRDLQGEPALADTPGNENGNVYAFQSYSPGDSNGAEYAFGSLAS